MGIHTSGLQRSVHALPETHLWLLSLGKASNLVRKITPEDDVRIRLGAASTNLDQYYLVTAITSTYISSPGWGLYRSIQLREKSDTVAKTTSIQDRAKQNLEFNRIKIDSADSEAVFRNFQSCCKDEWYGYHSSHSWILELKKNS